jgi:carbon-monoxide dehydrogenase medium subunit
VDEAVGLLAEHGFEAKVLAGGQSLVPMLSLRLTSFAHLVDINGVSGLDGIEGVDGDLRIGANVRQARAEHDPTVAEAAPLVAAAIPHIGHFQIRNRGTVGGSIAHADPASELPAVALALDAVMEAGGPNGQRTIAASDFFESTWETSLDDDEILTAVRFPQWSGSSGFAVEEVARRHGDFALVGAVCGVTLDGDAVTRAGIALFGVAPTPVRASDAEAALVAAGSTGDLTEVGRAAAEPLDPNDDLHASGAYRKKVASVVVQRALTTAIQEARS